MGKENDLRITLGSFNFIKGFAILMVIMGHMGYFYDLSQMKLLQSIYAGMTFLSGGLMPAFMIISGFGFKQKRVGVMLKSTFHSLIIPYLWVAGIFLVTYFIANFIGYGSLAWSAEVTLRWAMAFALGIPKSGHWLWGYEVLHCSAVWFFMALFLAMNLLNGILRVKRPMLRLGLVLLCVLLGYWMLAHDINYYCIPQGLLSVGFCYIGYLLKQHNLLTRRLSWAQFFAFAVGTILARALFGNLNMALGVAESGLWSYAANAAMAILIVYVGLLVGTEHSSLNWIRNVGLHSYWILCIHTIEDGCMQWELFIHAMPNQYIAWFGELAIKAVIIYSFCALLGKIQRMKFKRKRMRYGK